MTEGDVDPKSQILVTTTCEARDGRYLGEHCGRKGEGGRVCGNRRGDNHDKTKLSRKVDAVRADSPSILENSNSPRAQVNSG